MLNFIKYSIYLCLIALFCTSCTTSRVVGHTREPQVEIESTGIIWVGDKQVRLGKIGKALKRAGFSRNQEVKVLIADKRDRGLMQAVSADLVKHGFMRPIFITNKITQSTTKKKR